jgi:hypothetical protein
VLSNQPDRVSGPDVVVEQGLFLTFDDQGVLVQSKAWAFALHESLVERIFRTLGH